LGREFEHDQPGARIAAIEDDYPGWRVWISDAGRWYAVRQGPEAVWRRDCQVPELRWHPEKSRSVRLNLGALAPDLVLSAGLDCTPQRPTQHLPPDSVFIPAFSLCRAGTGPGRE
jgi:hypothetical protein